MSLSCVNVLYYNFTDDDDNIIITVINITIIITYHFTYLPNCLTKITILYLLGLYVYFRSIYHYDYDHYYYDIRRILL